MIFRTRGRRSQTATGTMYMTPAFCCSQQHSFVTESKHGGLLTEISDIDRVVPSCVTIFLNHACMSVSHKACLEGNTSGRLITLSKVPPDIVSGPASTTRSA